MKVVLDKGAYAPNKAHEWDAGFDLYAREDFTVPPCTNEDDVQACLYDDGYFFRVDEDETPDYEHKDLDDSHFKYVVMNLAKDGWAVHDTGVHIEIPDGYVGFLKSKSGLNVKHGLTSDGTIDAGYTGSIVVKLYNHTDKPYKFHAGEKITQIVILPIWNPVEIEIVDKLEETDRGNGGFGSSGK